MRRFSLFLVASLGLICVSGSKKETHVVTFHVQADATTSPKRKFEWPVGSQYFYEKSPALHWRHIQAYAPFAGDDGLWGAVFQLSSSGRNALRSAVSRAQGRYLICVVQGEPRGILLMDHTVEDGLIVQWERLTGEDLALFDKHFARAAETE
ncbi:MAG TPA: hypothetical protein VMN36_13755 [Verrucomicrobiales bacterium]|nr:hypothetical protein [Verrucomicrobiales bacterium]